MAILHHAGSGIFMFNCPGCKCAHSFSVDLKHPDRTVNKNWSWNGSFDKPTFRPSLRARGAFLCHSYVTDGQIRFLPDSEHELAGQTVDIPDWDW